MIKVIVGLLPGIIWLLPFILVNKDIFKNNYKKFFLLFLIGGIGSYICYRLEMHFGSYFKKTINSNYLEILFYAICGVAIFEEGYKWLLLFLSYLKEKNWNKLEILYSSIFISIGFATFENILYYAIPYGYKIAFTRIISAFFSHIVNALWMGYLLSKTKRVVKLKKYIYIILSIFIPIIIHAFYNSFLYGNAKYGDYFLYYYILLLISSIVPIILIFRKGER